MRLLSIVLIILVAFEFFYIWYLETIMTKSDSTARVFHLKESDQTQPVVQTLFKNQGVYNGLIGIGLIYSVTFAQATLEIARLLLIGIILVAAYGSWTSDKKIILTQGGLAIIALITTFF
ncbi:hypothetical protein A5886_000911 [Enterococcus sp. 8G7_MSG3316]|uniref:Integral membrane protein n=1 Tax=Candidatus Enterococcus testudinis TaxID=1834191 RepID=A0A242A472_9ENTE|nr:DUF1304 domain-containing protein [Enterococcus sp. 8G7_MSG3316]OTN75835.1 hypothetical protein A5886_000911 [Enterococcus sp. 8G7_MSG3316]